MTQESLIVVGTVLFGLSLVSFLTALTEGRPPRVAGFTCLVALGILGYAYVSAPEPLVLRDIPDAFFRSIANLRALLRL